MLAEVVVKSFLLSRAENIFTYKIPKNIEEEISVGKRVIVPFGKRNKGTVGLVINILDEKDVETDIKFKEINMVIDEKEIVSKTQIKLAKFMSEKYITNLSYCLNDKAKCRRDAALCFKQVLSRLEYLFYAALFLAEDAAELGHRIKGNEKGYCAEYPVQSHP